MCFSLCLIFKNRIANVKHCVVNTYTYTNILLNNIRKINFKVVIYYTLLIVEFVKALDNFIHLR